MKTLGLKILDRGNTQIRNLESEFVNYDITKKKKYMITLPVVNEIREEGDQNEGEYRTVESFDTDGNKVKVFVKKARY